MTKAFLISANIAIGALAILAGIACYMNGCKDSVVEENNISKENFSDTPRYETEEISNFQSFLNFTSGPQNLKSPSSISPKYFFRTRIQYFRRLQSSFNYILYQTAGNSLEQDFLKLFEDGASNFTDIVKEYRANETSNKQVDIKYFTNV